MGAYCLHYQGITLMFEAVSTYETLVCFYHAAWWNISEVSHLHIVKINYSFVMVSGGLNEVDSI
jgi:hypothetical protein